MFSGLVREIAPIKQFKNDKLYIQSTLKPSIGDSIAVNGMCLTVIENKNDGFILELTQHTQANVACENLKDKAHIEPALQIKDRFDGHFVQGHIDGIGEIISITHHHNQSDFFIKIPANIAHLLIPRGSVTIDGISLTISDCQDHLLHLTLIPHTLQNTLFGNYQVGRRVNIETDILVRSVAHILKQRKINKWEEFDMAVLSYS